jgi:cysteine desulfurase
MKWDSPYVEGLGRYLTALIREKIPSVVVNGSEDQRWFGCVNVSFEAVEGESLMSKLPNFAVSSGSACTSASLEPSYVLKAIGVSDELDHTSLRIGLSKFTIKEELDEFVAQLAKAVAVLRELSPLWEMKQSGVNPQSVKWVT